jgi:hypothetical protein
MSWAAHMVDRDGICIDGIAAKLSRYTELNWSELDDVLNIIREECPNAFAELVRWANKEVADSYADFLTKRYDS